MKTRITILGATVALLLVLNVLHAFKTPATTVSVSTLDLAQQPVASMKGSMLHFDNLHVTPHFTHN